MANDTITLTPGVVVARQQVMFPYPHGRTSADYARSGITVTVGSTVYYDRDDSFDVSFEKAGMLLTWLSATSVAASASMVLTVPLAPAPGGTLAAQSFAPVSRTQLGEPRKRTVAFLGHSFQAASFGSGGLLYTTAYPGWISVLCGDSVSIKHSLNFSGAGLTSTDLKPRVPDVIAAAPGVCDINWITNDTALPWTETRDNTSYAVSALRDVGILPVITLWTGRGGITTAQYNKAMRINDWIRTTYLGANGVFVVDPNELFTDYVTGLPRSGFSQGDDLHPSNSGGYFYAQPHVQLYQSLFPAPPYPISNTFDVYDATDNPTGNRLPGGGMMAGTGGALAGSAAGVAATGFTLTDANAGGATVTGSKGTMSDGRPCQIITLSGNYSGTTRRAEFNSTTNMASSFAAGQSVESAFDYEIEAGQQNICGVSVLANLLTSGGNLFPSGGSASTSYAMPDIAIAGRPKTDRESGILPGTPSSISFSVRIGMVNAGVSTPVSAVVKIASASLKGF